MAFIDFFDSKEVEWADMSVLFSGGRIAKIQGINWKPTQDKVLIYGEGNQPIGIQKGNKGYTANVKALQGAIKDIRRAAIAAGGEGPLDIEFDIVIKFREQGSRGLQLITLVACQITEVPEGWEQGATSMPCDLPILYLRQLSA